MEKCQRAGCTGSIVDGFCDECGKPPAGAKSVVTASAAAVASGAAISNSAAVNGGSVASRAGSAVSAISSGSSASGSYGSGRSGSGRSGRGSRGSRGSSRRALGAGLIQLPELPSMDPLLAVLPDPVVPERKRFCNNCGEKVGREKGFCPNCGQEYNFQPTLKPGDLVAGQYEVKGAIAFGGLGWIYLAWDTALSRWLVLKGLLNSKDAASAAAAIAERQFLAAVKHPKIVGVYNFVTDSSMGGMGGEGYIVMEYVGGKTLKTIRQERGVLPPAEAIAYILGILPAFSYLEKQGLVYCDFKPDNFMLEEDDVKLIDMGGVRRIDDSGGDVYGTKGYSAPEASEFPSFVSDLYTVARTLAVLMMDFKFQGANEFTIPSPTEQPVLAEHDSLYRFLLKGTRQDPDLRFQNADEMADQLLGVLRDVVAKTATDTDAARPGESLYFNGDALVQVIGDSDFADATRRNDYRLLPTLKLDALDPAANLILSVSVGGDSARQIALERACKQFPDSSEAPLRLAALHIEQKAYTEAEKRLMMAEAIDKFDWRVLWYRGRMNLARGQNRDAQGFFDRVYGELPGELAPKLAIALAAETTDHARAEKLYDLVSRVDPGFTTAAFGLARCLAADNNRDGAAAAYRRIPSTSTFFNDAQMALARVLIDDQKTAPTANALIAASSAVEALAVEGYALNRLSADLLLAAAKLIESNLIPADPARRIIGQPMEPHALRRGAEKALRQCARYAKSKQERFQLVDDANAVRPRTMF